MNKELNTIFKKIENKESLALIRFGDGEKNIIDDIPCKRSGFSYNPKNPIDQKFRTELIEALKYDGGNNYFVGIKNKKLEEKVNGTIISPMIFVNQNYLQFLEKLNKISNDIPIVLVVNKMSRLTYLLFKFVFVFTLEDNAWHTFKKLDEEIINWLNQRTEPTLILVAGGAYSCVLIHKIWQQNKNHILLDIGSTLDPWLFGQYTRKYHKRLEKC